MSKLKRCVLRVVIESECVPETMSRRNFRSLMDSACSEYIDATNINEAGDFLDAVWDYCKKDKEVGTMLTQADYNDIIERQEEVAEL